ncbi:AraC family transcriptional regulator [Sorangium sp. So ce726]|uniref:helix-turn-helix transcriptional regulator n=1 Tax=Sorangium sp. So ce726 TaxID=3133319 RepID=UPI003F5FE7D8
MDLSAAQRGRSRIAFSRPAALPGLTVGQFRSDGPLFTCVTDRYATALHFSGRSEWSLRGARWSSGPGTIDVKVPGEVFAEHARQGQRRFQVVIFDARMVDEARATLDSPASPPTENALCAHDPRAAPLAALHRSLLRGDATPLELAGVSSEALAALCELTTMRRDPPRPRSAWAHAVTRARELLDARFTESIALDELAAHARLDKFRLCRAFREEVGLPPHAYVTYRRVGLAGALLARGVPQAEVAARVGLYDQSQLHRHFKRIAGVTPGAYARAAR